MDNAKTIATTGNENKFYTPEEVSLIDGLIKAKLAPEDWREYDNAAANVKNLVRCIVLLKETDNRTDYIKALKAIRAKKGSVICE